MFRLLAWIFFAATAARLVFDWFATIGKGERFSMALVGDVWFNFHQESLQLIQPAIERYVSVALWDWVFRPLLTTPLAPILLGLAILFWLLGRWRRKRT
ncbi:MAG: hypothetical protein ACE5FS_06905 [Paracoccaceae bacterium]